MKACRCRSPPRARTKARAPEEALCPIDRLDDERTFPRHQRQTLRPARGDIDRRQGLDERVSHRRAAMSDHVNLAEPGRRTVPVIEVRIGISRRIAEYNSARRRLPPLAAIFTSASRRSMVAALMTRTVEDATLLRPFGRPVTLHHRRQHLAPRAHADLSRHRGHEPVWWRCCSRQRKLSSNILREAMRVESSALTYIRVCGHGRGRSLGRVQIRRAAPPSPVMIAARKA
ncbi:hypothetical protein ACVWZK_000049 [Bradyrhizobium sp. GM0.4]